MVPYKKYFKTKYAIYETYNIYFRHFNFYTKCLNYLNVGIINLYTYNF